PEPPRRRDIRRAAGGDIRRAEGGGDARRVPPGRKGRPAGAAGPIGTPGGRRRAERDVRRAERDIRRRMGISGGRMGTSGGGWGRPEGGDGSAGVPVLSGWRRPSSGRYRWRPPTAPTAAG